MKRLLTWLFVFLLTLLAISYYGILFGKEDQIGMVCFFNDTLGWQCPGCGGQRAVAALLGGDFKDAFVLNPLIYFYIILIGYLIFMLVEGYFLKNQKVIAKFSLPTNFGYWFLILILIFTLLRNFI